MRLKQLELWWRRLWIRLLVRLMRRPATGDHPRWGDRRHRVLFLRHDRAGDMIVSTGVMRAIARSYPTIAMDVLASPANADVLAAAPYVNEVIVFDRKKLSRYIATCLRLRRARYDAVVDCMVTAPSVTTLLLILASGARFRVGIAGRGNDAAFNITVPANDRENAHMVDLLAALAGAFDVDLETVARRPTIDLTDDEWQRGEAAWDESAPTSRRVLVNISAGKIYRTWPDDRFVAAIRHILDREPDATIRLISAPDQTDRARAIAAAAGGTVVTTPSIRDAFAVVATADFLLSPDTSIGHAASAFRTPAVLMFLRGKSTLWGLYDTPGTSIEHDQETLEALSLSRVLPAIDELLDRPFERRRIGHAALSEPR